ncbi:hypothetical protein GPECTOR_49g542 [Gonium pectorale]|uniref:Uncharacterized protein n=1 Tax=Gonium pectorale TaxID=33097 RepID=A0A150G806_GONPE|nr:hypothetical protein GPECTOR_49g542 [Gonium pectorale]|eukprot:KXZ45958.1 hypothetical protein GPECTOR_49g542 [Gonium pectorale]
MQENLSKPSPTCVRRFLVLGTPGIGKSVFLLDLLYRLACNGRTVVFYSPLTYPKALLFKPVASIDGRSVFEADNPSSFVHELTDPDTWLLCDSVEYTQMDAVTVMTSSPRAGAYNAFAKTSHLELWMGPWTLAEINAAYRLEPYRGNIDERTVDRLFNTWGGIPRYVLENAMIPSMQRKLDDTVASSDLLAVLRSVKQIEAAPEASHKLLHVQVNDACEKQGVVFGSEVIARLVTEKLQITVSSSHSVNDAKLAGYLAKLPPALRRLKPALLFAVPPDVFAIIGAQKTSGTGALSGVKQYALEVPIGGFESSSSSGNGGGGSSSSGGGGP